MNRPTVKDTQAAIRALGLSCSHKDRKYRVSYKPADADRLGTTYEGSAFYTDDADDALGTARHMAERLDRTGHDDSRGTGPDRYPDHNSV